MEAAAHSERPAVEMTSPSPRKRRILPSGLFPEEALLLLTAHDPPNETAMRAIVEQVVDWPRFTALAQVERAMGTVHAPLLALSSPRVPREILDQMRRLAWISDFLMLHLESRLGESVRALEAANVPVMLLKGAALARTAYARAVDRPMSDIDVLVEPANARLARRILLTAGWREIVGGVADSAYDQHHHLRPLGDARSPNIQLEIHTALFPERQPFAFDARDLWRAAVPLPQHRGVFVPSKVHLLLHACLHFAWSHQARFGVWRTIRDVQAISRCPDFDWDAFVAVARDARGATSCYWTLRIAVAAAGLTLPSRVLEELRPRRSAYVLRAVERHFLRNLFPVGVACPSVRLDQTLWELGIMPRKSGHGEVRPWHLGADVLESEETDGSASRTRDKMRSLLASPGYIRALLR
jgi:hypothetical protein